MARSYYDILGVPPTATPDDVAAAYRARALETHPDVAGDAACGAAFRELAEAYAVLKDPGLRARYDALLGGGGGGGAGGGPYVEPGFRPRQGETFDAAFDRWWRQQG